MKISAISVFSISAFYSSDFQAILMKQFQGILWLWFFFVILFLTEARLISSMSEPQSALHYSSSM